MYTTRHAQILFKVSSTQTIRNWAKEFASYLSPGATPQTGGTRYFNDEDMKVLALIANASALNRSFDEIHAALASGQRGDAPTVMPEEMDTLVAGEIERFLSTELDESRTLANRLQQEVDSLKTQVQPLREDNIRLQAQLQDRDKRIEELREELRGAQERVARLAEEKGEAYVKGIMEALQRRGELPSRDKTDG